MASQSFATYLEALQTGTKKAEPILSVELFMRVTNTLNM